MEKSWSVPYCPLLSPNGKEYIGKVISPERFIERQGEHDRATKRVNTYRIIKDKVPLNNLSLEAETAIRLGGGPATQGGTLENKRYEMNNNKYKSMGGNVSKPTGNVSSSQQSAKSYYAPSIRGTTVLNGLSALSLIFLYFDFKEMMDQATNPCPQPYCM